MNKLFPGMTDNSVEFFTHQNQLKFIKSGQISSFTDLPFATIEILREEIDKSLEVKTALHDLHPNSEMKRIEQFAMCRFGGIDKEGDIVDGKLQDGEFWACPMHGICPHEGVLCKLPVINGHRLSKQDVQLIKLLSTDKTNEVIAEELEIPLGTFHLAKKFLYKMLGNIQTKQELAILAMVHNII